MIENKYSVYVRCITYNQANYIKDTFNGFCMQQTTFPFVCAIFDDASTDGEIEIIKDYLNENFELDDAKIAFTKETDDYVLQYARHKVNHNCFFVVVFLKYNHWRLKKAKDIYVQEWIDKSEYKAECEGDDYWIDPLKLQKQVDFLDKHKDYSLVYTAYYRYYQNSGVKNAVYSSSKYIKNDNLKWALLTNDVAIGTTTVLYRKDLFDQIKTNYNEDFKGVKMSDVQTWFHFARLSKIHFIPEITAVYRKNEGGLTSINSKKRFDFLKNAFEVHLSLGNKYGAPQEIINKIKKNYGGSVISTGIEYRLYKELVAFCKEYLPDNKLRIMVFRIASLLPFIDKRVIRKLTLI